MAGMDTQSLAALFKTLSEPVRLRIVYLLLEKGELCVCDLVNTLELSQSVVSRHLAYLRNNQLVSTRREGVWVYYHITPCCCEPLFEHIRRSGKKNAEMQADLSRLEATSSQTLCG
jgi:ArsR family transcriptional regulator